VKSTDWRARAGFRSKAEREVGRAGRCSVDGSYPQLRIWIDLANSPHPLLFAPVARMLEAKGHEVLVTVRDNAQTAELARARWPASTLVGRESPANPAAKAATLARRVSALARWSRARHPDVAVSHNSYAQIVAARMLGVPVVTAADFEHQPANHLAFRLATRILMPEALRTTNVGEQGASPAKSVFYPGLKEELYIGDFEPDPEILSKLDIERSGDELVVVTRTPPTRAVYHRFPNPLFIETLLFLDHEPNVRLIVLARHSEQREAVAALGLRHGFVPAGAVDSRSLMYAADLVIGAGGTMTREAALLGIPTLSIFGGPQPAVDRSLEEQGLLRVLRNAADVGEPARRGTEPRTLSELRRRGAKLSEIFVSTIEATARAPRRKRIALAGRSIVDGSFSAR
jgi:predicted glycosyltransferase